MTIRLTFLCAPGGPGGDTTLDSILGDAPLSEASLRDAAVVGAALPPHGLAVRAPSVRCAQTAEAAGLVTVPEPALRNIGVGEWFGRTVDEVVALDPYGFSAWLTDPNAAPHKGESVRDLCRRTANWLDSVASDTGDAVAIAEAAVVRAALVHALGVPARAFWHLTVPPLSVVSLTWRRGHWDTENLGDGLACDEERPYAPMVVSPRRPARPAGSGQVEPGK
jgi:broad specificity phosphatase PhoE